MNINKALLPIIVGVSILLGAGGMYAGIMIVDGNSSAPVIEQADDATAGVIGNNGGDYTISEDYIEKFTAAYELILEKYYENVEESKLLEGAISGMLDTLEDPYSVYMDENTAKEFMESLDSSFEGIGAEVSMTNGKVTIVAPFRDSPAEAAGLRPNDQIIKVDGEDIEGLSLYEAVLKIRGEKGTTVTLTINRPGVSDSLEFEVVRDTIPIETVYSDLVEENGKNIGVLEISSFSENTAERFAEELTKLEEEGIDGLIIDVRGNPGGFLQSVEDIGNLIIPGGEPVVQIENREGETVRHISNLDSKKTYEIVGLINEGSASASEILAAALKEAGGYEIVGQTTFGKGTVQQSLKMGDGSEIKLTLYKWLTSGGNFINEVGVEPTVEVKQPEFFYASPINLEETLTYDMTNENIASAQVMLQGLGYDPERTDGYFSKETENAVKEFQKAAGITVSGEIDEKTAEYLQMEIINAVQGREFDLQFNKAVELLTGQ
ncbi:carboxyl-terminal processing protease [Evansella caseinilytica]|uniref:C-terminal processing peptidase n=1 Tax=Evansella caseinilytica TaxID=1503961 RepID=A0A1H3S9H0_9BACI|nr:S41 family peptidase [Evansella caseinilytica]SDZ34258.1 carboxyl-terminal processing protease [Evansella caseinilytica]